MVVRLPWNPVSARSHFGSRRSRSMSDQRGISLAGLFSPTLSCPRLLNEAPPRFKRCESCLSAPRPPPHSADLDSPARAFVCVCDMQVCRRCSSYQVEGSRHRGSERPRTTSEPGTQATSSRCSGRISLDGPVGLRSQSVRTFRQYEYSSRRAGRQEFAPD